MCLSARIRAKQKEERKCLTSSSARKFNETRVFVKIALKSNIVKKSQFLLSFCSEENSKNPHVHCFSSSLIAVVVKHIFSSFVWELTLLMKFPWLTVTIIKVRIVTVTKSVVTVSDRDQKKVVTPMSSLYTIYYNYNYSLIQWSNPSKFEVIQ